MRKLPDKTKLPRSGALHWCERYFDVGDTVKWIDAAGRSGTGVITGIKRNSHGRITYYAEAGIVFAEYIARFLGLSSMP